MSANGAGERIVVVGSSGHAKVVIDIAEKVREHEIVGVIDRFRPPGEQLLGYPILGGEEQLPELVESLALAGCVVAIGDNYTRGNVAQRIHAVVPSMRFVTLIHPSVSVARDVVFGEGTVAMAGVVVNTNSRIGRFCILNTSSTVDHDSSLADYASLAPGARTGGNVHIGVCAAIGIGATIIHRVRIGEHTVIGAGATVLEDIDPIESHTAFLRELYDTERPARNTCRCDTTCHLIAIQRFLGGVQK